MGKPSLKKLHLKNFFVARNWIMLKAAVLNYSEAAVKSCSVLNIYGNFQERYSIKNTTFSKNKC